MRQPSAAISSFIRNIKKIALMHIYLITLDIIIINITIIITAFYHYLFLFLA